jgi:NADH-quinone oxidoreductase subunit E
VTFAPEVDQRLRADAAQVIARYPLARSALLPLLHLVQSEEGYVSPNGIEFCADVLGLTTAEVSGVVTFYTQYKRHPNGEYTVGVCTNTLCAVMGGDQIFEELSDYLGVAHDETTDDGAITLERVECNAACDFAPVLMVNWEFFDNQTPASARRLVDDIQAGKTVVPTRGAASVCTFKQMSRVLAGFPDGRADEGVGAAGATLEGLKVAHARGWSVEGLHDDRGAASGGRSDSGGDAPVEQIAQDHVNDPGSPSAHDAAGPGQPGREPRKRTSRPKRKDA